MRTSYGSLRKERLREREKIKNVHDIRNLMQSSCVLPLVGIARNAERASSTGSLSNKFKLGETGLLACY